MKYFLATMLLGFIALIPVRAAEEAESWEFTMKPGAELELETFKGVIDIQTHDAPTIIIRADVRPDGDDCDPRSVEVFARERGGGGVHVWIEHHPGEEQGFLGVFKTKSYTAPFVDFTIVMPDDARIQIDDHKSEYKISAPSGSISIDTHKGTGWISNVRSNLDLDTHKGEFDIEVQHLEDIDIDTYKGDITVTVHRAMDFEVRAETHKGDLSFDGRNIDVMTDEDGEKTVDHREGAASHTIQLETYKGTIDLIFKD